MAAWSKCGRAHVLGAQRLLNCDLAQLRLFAHPPGCARESVGWRRTLAALNGVTAMTPTRVLAVGGAQQVGAQQESAQQAAAARRIAQHVHDAAEELARLGGEPWWAALREHELARIEHVAPAAAAAAAAAAVAREALARADSEVARAATALAERVRIADELVRQHDTLRGRAALLVVEAAHVAHSGGDARGLQARAAEGLAAADALQARAAAAEHDVMLAEAFVAEARAEADAQRRAEAAAAHEAAAHSAAAREAQATLAALQTMQAGTAQLADMLLPYCRAKSDAASDAGSLLGAASAPPSSD
jgi:colicin import membrane protein